MEWDQDDRKDEGVIPRASIHSIKFRLFNQENPYVSKLTESELYYLSHRNCHKYCRFQELWENENAVLLSLEDIGLITEKMGYPHRKRLELEITVTWKTNAALDVFRGAIGITTEELAVRTLRLRTVCVYENGEFIGDIRRSEFVEKYI